MSRNYSKLLGRVREYGMTQKELSRIIGINPATLNAKLRGKNVFTAQEIASICKTLEIPNCEIGVYFFAE